MAAGSGLFYVDIPKMTAFAAQLNNISIAADVARMKVATINTQICNDKAYAGCSASLGKVHGELVKEKKETNELRVCMTAVAVKYTVAEKNIVGDKSSAEDTSVQNYGSVSDNMNDMGVEFDS